MIVSGVGGSTSLPMTLPGYTTSSSNSTVPSLKSKSTSDSTTTATDGSGEAKFPSEQRTKGAESAREAKKEEEPKPKPLPPLKGLTVSEIRAMLGVAPLPGQEVRPGSVAGIGMAALNTTQSVSTAFLRQNRYSQYQYA
ncbi:MAG: hypothetical protein QG622_3135 [Actinomycetota bacterium]|nr:hypothetical protein [Actinomycetota bacterium]